MKEWNCHRRRLAIFFWIAKLKQHRYVGSVFKVMIRKCCDQGLLQEMQMSLGHVRYMRPWSSSQATSKPRGHFSTVWTYLGSSIQGVENKTITYFLLSRKYCKWSKTNYVSCRDSNGLTRNIILFCSDRLSQLLKKEDTSISYTSTMACESFWNIMIMERMCSMLKICMPSLYHSRCPGGLEHTRISNSRLDNGRQNRQSGEASPDVTWHLNVW